MMCLSFPLSDTLGGANLCATRQSTRVKKGDASPIWARNGSLANFLENSVPANFRECPKGEVRRIPIPRTRVNKAQDRSVVLLPEGWLPLNDYVRQTLPG